MIKIQVDKKNDKPLYVQIRDRLEQAILDRELNPGDKLPSVSAFSKKIGVTQATIRRALEDLSKQGYTKCHVGRGTFVEEPPTPDIQKTGEMPDRNSGLNSRYGLGPARPELQCAARRLRRGVSEGLLELMNLAQQPGLIDFAKGVPDPSLHQSEFLKEMADFALKTDPVEFMSCSNSHGLLELRQLIADRYRARGVPITPEQVLITNGSQQAASLVALDAAEKNQPVICEAPCFQGIPETFLVHGNWVDTIRRDSQGPIPEYLAQFSGHPYLFYLSEFLHSPTGLDLGGERRTQIVKWAHRNDATLLIDGVVDDLVFDGAPQQSLFNDLGADQVILISSLSKTMMSGLRVGWMISSVSRIQSYLRLKRLMDQACPPLMQGIAAGMLSTGRYDAHLERIRVVYQRRQNVFLDGLKQLMPESVTWTQPKGGFYLWITLPEGYSSVALLLSAVDKGISFLPGPLFDLDQRFVKSFRVSYAWATREKIEEGVEILADTVKEVLRHSPGDLGLSGLGNFQ